MNLGIVSTATVAVNKGVTEALQFRRVTLEPGDVNLLKYMMNR
jgi:hypothetical protein